MDKQVTVEMLKRHFGPNETIEPMFWGGWRITMQNGDEVEYTEDDRFHNFAGGPHLYRAFLLAANEAWGQVVVRGPEWFMLSVMACGEELGIQVIPEIWHDEGGALKAFVAGTTCAVIAGVLYFFVPTPPNTAPDFVSEHPFYTSLIAGAVVSWTVMLWISPAIDAAMKRKARQAAQYLRNTLPALHGSERAARREEAKRRGLI